MSPFLRGIFLTSESHAEAAQLYKDVVVSTLRDPDGGMVMFGTA